ncbi:DUF3854 domain-containing protein [Nostoc sp. MG11]|uniref:DUF3854 domain-containing protein n=1 Tax=Nostoc sp. MG11 TaxID=2721166 RepID=UPI0029FEFA35|nr:DUF3854 domain-containing protein [Nostoc sp. MG11]
MFDERSLNLVSSYVTLTHSAVTSIGIIWQKGIMPLLEAYAERLRQQAELEATQKTPSDEQLQIDNLDFDDTDYLEKAIQSLPDPPPKEIPRGNIFDTDVTPPQHLDEKHWTELVKDSYIHPDIAAKNFKTLRYDHGAQENEAWSHVLYSDNLERINTGQLNRKTLETFAHLDAGGWWGEGGVDARSFPGLESGQQPDIKLWGCCKPNEPRTDPNKPDKKIKYEHPFKEPLAVFLLEPTEEIANQVYQKAGVSPSDSDRTSGFWYSVWKHNIPVVVTEGAKKAASILSQGDAAIGLPGINAGYRVHDEQKNDIPPQLREEFAIFATEGREIKICFDYDTRPKTIRSINQAISQTGELLEQKGVKVSVITVPGTEKGVDDLIVSRAPSAYHQINQSALPLEKWKELQESNKLNRQKTIFLKNGQALKLDTQDNQTHINVNSHNFSPELGETGINETIPDPWLDTKPIVQNNEHIAYCAKNIVDEYGQMQRQGDYSQSIYRAESFTIVKSTQEIRDWGDVSSYSLHKNNSLGYQKEQLAYFSFESSTPDIRLSADFRNSFTSEKQDFLRVADALNKGQQLPPRDDPQKLSSFLGSLEPQGTQAKLNSLIKDKSPVINNEPNSSIKPIIKDKKYININLTHSIVNQPNSSINPKVRVTEDNSVKNERRESFQNETHKKIAFAANKIFTAYKTQIYKKNASPSETYKGENFVITKGQVNIQGVISPLYSLYSHSDQKTPLLSYVTDESNAPFTAQVSPALPEQLRQDFLRVASALDSGQNLPPLQDYEKMSEFLGSLSPEGIQTISDAFKKDKTMIEIKDNQPPQSTQVAPRPSAPDIINNINPDPQKISSFQMAKMVKDMMKEAQKEGLSFTQPTPQEQKLAQEDLKNLLSKSRNVEQSKEQAKPEPEPTSLKKDGLDKSTLEAIASIAQRGVDLPVSHNSDKTIRVYQGQTYKASVEKEGKASTITLERSKGTPALAVEAYKAPGNTDYEVVHNNLTQQEQQRILEFNRQQQQQQLIRESQPQQQKQHKPQDKGVEIG